MKRVLVLISVAAAILFVWARSPVYSASAALTPAEDFVLEIEAREFSFTPIQTVVNVGQTVVLELKNTGVVVHDLSINKIALKESAITANRSSGDMMGGMTSHMNGAGMMHGNGRMMGGMTSHMNGAGMMHGNGHMMGGITSHMNGAGGSTASLSVVAQAGETATVTFTPTEPGEYEFYCTVPGHKASGMVGTLIVVTQ